ncbi:MAG: hypothetical protein RL223_2145 [Pseudomonadota bacterium]|jgi:YfiH family protein
MADPLPADWPGAWSPDWAAPPQVVARMSTRLGGHSAPPCDSLNFKLSPGLAPAQAAAETLAVQANRARWAQALDAQPVWLDQVHGSLVQRLDGRLLQALAAGAAAPVADAAITTEPGIACTVMVADCLPVLLCTRDGRAVGAAHAGWRGLAGGVLEATATALCEAAGVGPDQLLAWLGPCIGPQAFEVGPEVLQAFGAEPLEVCTDPAFVARRDGQGRLRWLADLPALARRRLQAAGLGAVDGGRWCTVSDPLRWHSYRRDHAAGPTGRLAASIAIRPL